MFALLTTAAAGPQLLALAMGTVAGLFAGLMPGVSGRVGLVVVTPVAVMLGPVAGPVFLVAFHSVVHTSGSVPAILLGAPTSAAEAATVIDGYAMTRKGEAARAIGASLAASAVGGVIGAIVLLVLAPLALVSVRYIGAPESAALALLGLMSISALSGNGMSGGLAGGLASAALGIIIASIGFDAFSTAGRFTFGRPELSDGVNVATVVTGLFVVPELLVGKRRRLMTDKAAPVDNARVLDGFFETLRYRWLLLRTSLLGAFVGLIPGLGAAVSVWLAYGHARQTEPSSVPYGEGAIQGVIAPEAANNSKEGGSLAPTLFFGIPGSSGMGILLAAFMLVGVEIGPRMLMRQPDFIYLMGLTNIFSNLIAVPICLVVLPLMARIATIRAEAIAPIALAAGISATWVSEPIGFTLLSLVAFSAVGLMLKAADLPRAPLLLGFVLAPSIEQGAIRAGMIHGFDAFARPGVLLIAGIGLAIALSALIRRTRKEQRPSEPETDTPMLFPALAVLTVVMLAAMLGLGGVPPLARAMPGIAAAIGLAATLTVGWRSWRHNSRIRPAARPDPRLLLLVLVMLVGIWAIGAPVAAGLFAIAALILVGRVPLRWAITAGVAVGTLAALLESLQR